MQATLAFVTDAEFSLASGKTITNGYGGDAAGNSKGVFSSRRADKKVSRTNQTVRRVCVRMTHPTPRNATTNQVLATIQS